MLLGRYRSRVRRGMAAMEIVFTTCLALPIAALILALLILTVRRFFGMLGNGVGLPYF